MTKDKKLEEIINKNIAIDSDVLDHLPADVMIDAYITYGGLEEILKHYIFIDEIKILIAREITIANSEGQPTSRLTSLYNKLSIDKSKEGVTNE